MNAEPDFDTATMARLYAAQGYLRKALALYQRLTREHPQRHDLQAALAAVKDQVARHPELTRAELGLMLRQWIELMTRKKQIEQGRSIPERGQG